MYLGESGGDIGLDEIFRVRHRLSGGELPPPVRAEVIPTQNYAIFRKPMAPGYAHYELTKVYWGHARVPAELVDLVRRGLDKYIARIVECLQHRGLEYEWVRGADRIDADGLASLVSPDGVEQRAAHGTDASSSIEDSTSSRMCPSLIVLAF